MNLSRLFLLLLLFTAAIKPVCAEHNYLNQLILKSRDLKLSTDPQWLKLVHYEKNSVFNGYESLASSKEFFNAEEGPVNPLAELEATLVSFFDKSGRKISQEQAEPYQCAFRARFIWLDSKLGFENEKMPFDSCDRYEQWIKAIEAKGLTLIFPSSYINNPASAFGHTFLRIDQTDQNANNRLLAYTANFAAETEGEAGLDYAIKGVFGGYQGFFSVSPYYEKVKLYSDMERRDIWEYPLDFSKQETDFLLAHLWELRSIGFTYYYFDQNCSYYLLGLLEAARPSLKLSERFRTWVIPVDSVRAITENDQSETKPVFRPSSVSDIQALIAANTEKSRYFAKKLADGKIEPSNQEFQSLSRTDQVMSADLAYQYLNFLILSGKDKDNQMQQRAYALLIARSKLTEMMPVIAQRPEVSPDKSHFSSKLGVASGFEDRDLFYDLNLRFAYHDLLDPVAGFSKGSQIELFDLSLRHEYQEDPDLQKAMILDVKSLSASNEFIDPLSWKLDFGFEKEQLRMGNPELIFKLNAGFGKAVDLKDNLFAYGLLDLNNLFNEELEQGFATGFGPESGLIYSPMAFWQIGTTFSVNQFVFGDEHTSVKAGLEQSFSLGQNKALRLNLEHTHSFGRETNLALLSIDLYL